MMEALQLLLPAVLSVLAWHKGSRVACLPPFPAAPAPASAVHPPSSRPSVSPRPPSPCALINSYPPSNPGGGGIPACPLQPSPPSALLQTSTPCGLSPPPLGRGSCAVSLPHSLHLCVSPTVRPPDQDPPGLGFRGGRGSLHTGAATSAHLGQCIGSGAGSPAGSPLSSPQPAPTKSGPISGWPVSIPLKPWVGVGGVS